MFEGGLVEFFLCIQSYLGFGALLLVWKAMYLGGVYDTWSRVIQ
jgi:hypothetical protein